MAGLFLQEKGYIGFRTILGTINEWFLNDYETIVHTGQALISRFKIPSLYSNYSRYLSSLNINRSLFSLQFDSPVTYAAFESHLDSLMFWLNLGCGGGCFKTIRLNKSVGNQRPRLQKLEFDGKEHLINALGLPGPGVEGLITMIKQHSILKRNNPLGFSIGGHSLDEYKSVANHLIPFVKTSVKQPYFEINISCPNTDTGKSLHDNVLDLEKLLVHIRELTNIVTVIKVSPDASNSNICDIASLVKGFDQMTLNAGNTQLKSTSEVGLRAEQISIGKGGLSGPQLYGRTLEMTKLLAQFKLPIIATGGISNANQINQLLNEGATVVGVATQLVKNPFSIKRMNIELAKLQN